MTNVLTNKELKSLIIDGGCFDIVGKQLLRYSEIIKDENFNDGRSFQRITTFKKGKVFWIVDKINGEIESITFKNNLK